MLTQLLLPHSRSLTLAGGNSLFNLPVHASWRLRFNPQQVMLQEQIGSISKIGLWQAGIHNSKIIG
jgi:hypothetical protein